MQNISEQYSGHILQIGAILFWYCIVYNENETDFIYSTDISQVTIDARGRIRNKRVSVDSFKLDVGPVDILGRRVISDCNGVQCNAELQQLSHWAAAFVNLI